MGIVADAPSPVAQKSTSFYADLGAGPRPSPCAAAADIGACFAGPTQSASWHLEEDLAAFADKAVADADGADATFGKCDRRGRGADWAVPISMYEPPTRDELVQLRRSLRAEADARGVPTASQEQAEAAAEAQRRALRAISGCSRRATSSTGPPPPPESAQDIWQDGREDADTTPISNFKSREELKAMGDEMKEKQRLHHQDTDDAQRHISLGCPVLLSLRMRRILEIALRRQPDVAIAAETREELRRVSCKKTARFIGAVLDDDSAKAIATLLFKNRISPAMALTAVSFNAVRLKGDFAMGAEARYSELLDFIERIVRNDKPLADVDLTRFCAASASPPSVGSHSLQLLNSAGGGASASGVGDARSASLTTGPRGPLRAFFGPEDDAASAQPYILKRKIVMSELPISQKQDLITCTIKTNQVTLLHGETGSGKTTQVPSFVLQLAEEARRSANGCATPWTRIVVTQPRRIAAITVAKRVAEELGEVVGEGVVGYKVRGISVCSPKCRILFCTTGVLLRRLAQEGQEDMFSAKTVTHLLVDEVHERNCETDFMLTFLRQAIKQRSNLKVVLMSATMDAECFLRYFSLNVGAGCPPPLLRVEGRCYPTHEVFLETVQEKLGIEAVGGDRGMSPDELRRSPPRSSSDSDGIDYDLIVDILKAIDSSEHGAWQFVDSPSVEEVRNPKAGAVLIFLPGTGEIAQLLASIDDSDAPAHWWVLQLHGALGAEEQQDAFKTVLPAGKTLKIIACTNVAETSVTVPDVTVVIDSCRERRTGIDKFSNTPQLKEQYCALDSLKQRRGRAGRVQPGVCLRLLTKSRVEALDGKTLPEMQRVPLENLYLQLCAMNIGNQVDFFATTPDPPERTAVSCAKAALEGLGALDDKTVDGLTPLGRHLAALPCHPRLGKMLILGCILGVPGPVMNICAAMTGRSPMMTTQDTGKRSAWQSERGKLLKELGQNSDHCAWAVLMHLWMHKDVARKVLCRKYGLSYERMQAAFFERRHISESLAQVGFLAKSFLQDERDAEDLLPPDWNLVRAAVSGGLFPNVVHAARSPPKFSGPTSPGDRNKNMKYTVKQSSVTPDGKMDYYPKSCNMHPNSLCFGAEGLQCPFLVFYTLQQTTKLFVYDATEASVWALLLFSGIEPVLEYAIPKLPIPTGITLGVWATFPITAVKRDGERFDDLLNDLVHAARRDFQAVLARKLREPTFDAHQAPEVRACVELLRTNGLGFLPACASGASWPLLEQLREESAQFKEQLEAEKAEKTRETVEGRAAVVSAAVRG